MMSIFELPFCLGNISHWGTDSSCKSLTFYIWSFSSQDVAGGITIVSIDCKFRHCSLLRSNVNGKMCSWSGFWHYITMVSLHLISNRNLFISVLEKKLAIILKALLVLEVMAKAMFVVRGNLIAGGTAPWRHRTNGDLIYCCFQSVWFVSLQTIRYVGPLVSSLHPYISRIGMVFLVADFKYERLTVAQVYSTRIRSPASDIGSI